MSSNKSKQIGLMILVLLLLPVSKPSIAVATGETTLVSLAEAPQPMEANNSSYDSAISANGQFVVFQSYATTLVGGDTNDVGDIFVHDRQTGVTELVSVDSNGVQANDHSNQPTISADGRYVAFQSDATNLVSTDTNGAADIFLHDRQTGQTVRVSVSSSGAQAIGSSSHPFISGSGRFVAFISGANNLVVGDTNGNAWDIFVHDRVTGITERVSIHSSGAQAENLSFQPSISADGRFVTFVSGENFVSNDTNGTWDVFVHDRQTHVTERVSVDSSGRQGTAYSYLSAISSNGQFVAFASAAALVSGDTPGTEDLFVHDRQSHVTERIALGPIGTTALYNAYFTSISGDGRFVAFKSSASNLVANDTNGKPDIFVYDRQLGQTERISVSSDGVEADYDSTDPSISADGQVVAFISDAENLVNNDVNRRWDVFIHDRQDQVTERVSLGPISRGANFSSGDPDISTDGRYIAFSSWATNLVSGDTIDKRDVFVFDRQTGRTDRVSVHSSGAQAQADSDYPSISDDGRFVAFKSPATNLVDNDTNAKWDIFVRDRQSGQTIRVSVDSNGVQGNQDSHEPAISANGRFVAFQSDADNLVIQDHNNVSDVFVHDQQTGLTERISVEFNGLEANGGSYKPTLSANGRYVAFTSRASNLVSGDTNDWGDIFVYDRQNGLTERISIDSNGSEANGDSWTPVISADGRFVAFDSDASNLVSGDTNNTADVFVHDRQTGLTFRASVNSNGEQSNGVSSQAAISGDGRFVAFSSSAGDLVAEDTNEKTDVFIHDNQTGLTELASVGFNGAMSNGYSYDPSLSGDGTYIAFDSIATNLVSDDGNESADVFVHRFISNGSSGLYVVTKSADTDDGVCDRDCSLREAVAAAISGGTIRFAPSLSGQTISLSSSLVIDKQLIIDGTDLASRIHISGNGTVTVFQIAPYVQATLRGLVIENGWGMQGGGIHVDDEATLELEDCAVLHSNAVTGGGVYSGHAMLRLLDSVISDNAATGQGGGLYIHGTGVVITKSTLSQNNAQRGGGLYINEGTLDIRESVISSNTAIYGGGMDLGHTYNLALLDSTVIGNTASYGGGVYHNAPRGTLTIAKSTFSGNEATSGEGGAVYSGWDLYVENSTFVANHAATLGGGVFNTEDLTVQSSTFSGNSANLQGGAVYNQGRFNFANTVLANSTSGGDCYQSDAPGSGTFYNVQNLVEQNSAPPHHCGIPALTVDPLLGPLQDNGGITQTMAPGITSAVIDAAAHSDCTPNDQRGVTRPQGNYCDIGAYEAEKPIVISIRGMPLDSYLMDLDQSQRVSYAGINGGPVILSTMDGTPLVASQRVIYRVNGVNTSYSEMMAVPWGQLDTTYWLPWYNNVDLDSQLRMTNISGETATVQITIAGNNIPGGRFTLGPSESIRKSFAGVNNGPVKITSQLPLVVSERVIYKVNGIPTSFSEMIGLQGKYVDTTYWIPWYNNVDLDSQLRIANVTDQPALVTVSIGGVAMPSFSVAAGASTRFSYAGVNAGPVKIVSTQNIVAAERVIYKVKGVPTSFSEMTALPQNQLNFTYWLPWYNNKDLDSQVRVANASSIVPATVHITLHGVELPGSPFTLEIGQSIRKDFPGVNDGPVHIYSDAPIVVSTRVIYKVNGVATSFSETMPLSGNPTNISHVLPWYNNVDLDSQLRVGVPR